MILINSGNNMLYLSLYTDTVSPNGNNLILIHNQISNPFISKDIITINYKPYIVIHNLISILISLLIITYIILLYNE